MPSDISSNLYDSFAKAEGKKEKKRKTYRCLLRGKEFTVEDGVG